METEELNVCSRPLSAFWRSSKILVIAHNLKQRELPHSMQGPDEVHFQILQFQILAKPLFRLHNSLFHFKIIVITSIGFTRITHWKRYYIVAGGTQYTFLRGQCCVESSPPKKFLSHYLNCKPIGNGSGCSCSNLFQNWTERYSV